MDEAALSKYWLDGYIEDLLAKCKEGEGENVKE